MLPTLLRYDAAHASLMCLCSSQRKEVNAPTGKSGVNSNNKAFAVESLTGVPGHDLVHVTGTSTRT